MQNFDKTYATLNDEQKKAVDCIEGPLLVLAGPGTGKTELLSARVANILIKTDTDPANIICLTFTVNAANNMRERLRKMIGARANQVIIKTFHSLAADIITNNPEYFYAGAVLNPISDLAAQQILLSILDKLPHDNPLAVRFDDKYVHMGNILTAIGKAKDAGLSPDKLSKLISEHKKDIEAVEPDLTDLFSKSLSHKTLENLLDEWNIMANKNDSALAISISKLLNDSVKADIPSGKTTLTGKLKSKLISTKDGQKAMVRERKANDWWKSLVDVYETYQTSLYKQGYLDYSDMLIGVIEALESNEDLRFDIQELTQYLLIDEFQDSNEAQIKLMHLLADNPHIEKPNIMVVGDPNQTIYGFNGAMLDNTSDFQRFYSDNLTTTDLVDNYRSSQEILDTSRKIITPYSDFHPDLRAEKEPINTNVDFNSYMTEADQAVRVCEAIQKLISKKEDKSIAVLARKHASLSHLSRVLMSSGLTVNYDQNIDIRYTSGNILIINILALIQAITSGDQTESDYRLSEILRHPTFGINPTTTWELALSSRRNNTWIELASNNPETQSITEWIHKLVSVSVSQPLHVLIEQILSLDFQPKQTLYQSLYNNDSAELSVIEAQATRQLLQIAGQYAQSGNVDLKSFVAMLRETSNKLFMFSATTGYYENAVTLMTVHGAKGLEFDHVFIIDCNESEWKAKSSRYPIPLSLPIHISAESPADYARLMYVAMTRAKQTLQISYVLRVDSKTTALPAEQLAQIEFKLATPVSKKLVAKSEVVQILPQLQRPKAMAELLADKLSNYSLSATHLTNFMDLTKENMETFIEDNLLRFPQPASDVLAHGIAMHAAMELAQIQTTKGKFNIKSIKHLYSLKLSESFLTSDTIKRLTNKAESQLDTLFEDIGLKISPTSKPEQSFSAITSNGLQMYGKIDRIDIIDSKSIRIADYKTGKPITSPKSNSQDILLKQWRHRLQLGFYILLIKQQKSYKNKTINSQIIQLDAQSHEHLYLDYDIDSSELKEIEALATIVFNKIKYLDFPDTSKYTPNLSGIKNFYNDLLSQ